jgi:hypothetical protein
LSEQWFFPAGRAIPGVGESYVIFNPTDELAEIEFELKPDSADRAGDIAPLQVTVGGRERWVVNVTSHETHPVNVVASVDATGLLQIDEKFFASIRSFNGVPVVAERVLTRPLAAGPGVASSLGVSLSSTDQMMALPAPTKNEDGTEAERTGTLAILNPAGDTISRVQVWVGRDGAEELRAEIELAPRRRAVFGLDSLDITDDGWIRVTSSTGTMAELVVSDSDTIVVANAVPVAGSTEQPDLLAFD